MSKCLYPVSSKFSFTKRVCVCKGGEGRGGGGGGLLMFQLLLLPSTSYEAIHGCRIHIKGKIQNTP